MTPQDTQYLAAMIKAYVPEAAELPWPEAVALAEVRDVMAADQLSDDFETQLNLEAAAAVVNSDLDAYYEHHDLLTIGNFTGYTN